LLDLGKVGYSVIPAGTAGIQSQGSESQILRQRVILALSQAASCHPWRWIPAVHAGMTVSIH